MQTAVQTISQPSFSVKVGDINYSSSIDFEWLERRISTGDIQRFKFCGNGKAFKSFMQELRQYLASKER